MAKKCVRLSDEKAKFLGLELKKHAPGRKTAVYRITPEEQKKLKRKYAGEKPLRVVNKSETSSNNYKEKGAAVMTALDNSGKVMNIDKYCKHYNLPRQDIKSYKLVSHTGVPYYNVVFDEQLDESEIDWDRLRLVLNQQIEKTYQYKSTRAKLKESGVLKWADLHFGAHIRNLLLTSDYDDEILYKGLMRSAEKFNRIGYNKGHVHIHGDLIESFSGLNHINSWHSMDKDLIGPKAVIMCVDLLDKVFQSINNLGAIKIVAGNHDRTSKNNDEDVKGGAAELIAWGLRLKGYDVEFHPYILTHEVDGINYIIMHGDKVLSKRKTEDILWKYGKKGKFNMICEAHLHTNIERLSVAQVNKFDVVKDDGVDHRRMTLPAMFPGNYYSETLGFTSNPGYVIMNDNGYGKPEVFNGVV